MALVFSCSRIEQENGILNIEIDEAERPKLIIDIKEIIPLGTLSNVLSGKISKVEYFNHHYYFFDTFADHSLLVFDDEGNFLRKTKRGKGPGEVIRPDGFTINKADSVVLLYDTPQRSSLIFDLDLNLIKYERYEDLFILYDFYHIGRDSFLIFHHFSTTNPPNRNREVCNYSLFTQNFKKQDLLDIPLTDNKHITSARSPVSITDSEVLFVTPWNNNIYELKNGNAKVWRKLDFGRYTIPNEDLRTLPHLKLRDMMNQGSGVAQIHGVFKTDDFIVLTFWFKTSTRVLFQSLNDNISYYLNDSFDSHTIPELTIYGVKDDGTFYGLIEPGKLIKFQKETGLFRDIIVRPVDNPLLVLFSVSKL